MNLKVPDITYCMSHSCPHANTCARFTDKPKSDIISMNDFWKSAVDNKADDCDFYIPSNEWLKALDMNRGQRWPY